ncbi:hypothetical protein [Georgenia sp. SUBG003]|uniref:hypothetical protein n=1 Tax=Georgenia sp. SUBG003 TaxID=1497974 RepID=UPI003AB847A0
MNSTSPKGLAKSWKKPAKGLSMPLMNPWAGVPPLIQARSAGGHVAQAEELVEERPQEGPADDDAAGGERLAGGAGGDDLVLVDGGWWWTGRWRWWP